MEITRERFRHLPLLLSRAEFLEVTGLEKRELAVLIENKAIAPWRPPGKRGCYAKYRKVDAARIAGVEEWLK